MDDSVIRSKENAIRRMYWNRKKSALVQRTKREILNKLCNHVNSAVSFCEPIIIKALAYDDMLAAAIKEEIEEYLNYSWDVETGVYQGTEYYFRCTLTSVSEPRKTALRREVERNLEQEKEQRSQEAQENIRQELLEEWTSSLTLRSNLSKALLGEDDDEKINLELFVKPALAYLYHIPVLKLPEPMPEEYMEKIEEPIAEEPIAKEPEIEEPGGEKMELAKADNGCSCSMCEESSGPKHISEYERLSLESIATKYGMEIEWNEEPLYGHSAYGILQRGEFRHKLRTKNEKEVTNIILNRIRMQGLFVRILFLFFVCLPAFFKTSRLQLEAAKLKPSVVVPNISEKDAAIIDKEVIEEVDKLTPALNETNIS